MSGPAKNLPPFPKRTCPTVSVRLLYLSTPFQLRVYSKAVVGGGEGFEIAARGGGGGSCSAYIRVEPRVTIRRWEGRGGGGRKKKKRVGQKLRRERGGVQTSSCSSSAGRFTTRRRAKQGGAAAAAGCPPPLSHNLNLHNKNPTQVAAEAAQRQLLESEMTRVLHGRIVLSTAYHGQVPG